MGSKKEETHNVHHLDSADYDCIGWITIISLDIVPVHNLALHRECRLGHMGGFDSSATLACVAGGGEEREHTEMIFGSNQIISIHPHQTGRRWKCSWKLPRMVPR